MSGPVIPGSPRIMSGFSTLVGRVPGHFRTVVLALTAALVLLLALFFWLVYRPVTVWDFSKTHTLADIGVNDPPSDTEWINASYFGYTSRWWLGDFPGRHLDLLIRLPGNRAFQFGDANVTFYGRSDMVGGMTIRATYGSLASGGRRVESWLRYWHFSAKDRQRFEEFMAHVKALAREGHNPEINLSHDARRGPSAAAAMWTSPIAAWGKCTISVSIFWSNPPNSATGTAKNVESSWSR